MNLPPIPEIQRQNSPELNSNQSIHNNGVPSMVVYLLAAFLMVVFLVVFASLWKLGQLSGEVTTLQSQVKQYEKNLEVKRLMDARSLEDQLRAEIAYLKGDK